MLSQAAAPWNGLGFRQNLSEEQVRLNMHQRRHLDLLLPGPLHA